MQANDVDLQDDNEAHPVSSALRTLRERQHILGLPLLESVIARCSYNGASSAVEMIAAHGTQEAFDSLLAVYEGTPGTDLKDIVVETIETLAGRLGLRVRKVGSRLEATAN